MRLFLVLLLSAVLLACTHHEEVKQIIPMQAVQESQFVASDYLNKSISVTIENGQADFHNINGFSAYERIVFLLKPGQVLTKSLIKAGDDFFYSNARITLRYDHGVLYVDELALKNTDLNYLGVQFNLNEAWINGQVYKSVSSDGFANLKNADITVKIDQ